ncbi:MAG: DNA polymerase III subunit chi [Pseudomonadota bacterium]
MADTQAAADQPPGHAQAQGEVRFYHLQRMPVEKALRMILSRVVQRGQRAVVVSEDSTHIKALDQALWSGNPDDFLPHGRVDDPAMAAFAAEQPIWLTDSVPDTDQPMINGANVLLQIDGAGTSPAAMAHYAIGCDLFDGHDDQAVKQARARWVTYRDAGFDLTYWQETPQGGWEQKAAHSASAADKSLEAE